jgi:hypothetical protein
MRVGISYFASSSTFETRIIPPLSPGRVPFGPIYLSRSPAAIFILDWHQKSFSLDSQTPGSVGIIGTGSWLSAEELGLFDL